MIRTAIVLFLVAAAAVAILALTRDAGAAQLTWLDWRIEMTAAAAALLVLFAALAATLFWRLAIWLLEMPRRAEQARTERRRRGAGEALARGFLASAAGDGGEARRQALKAAELSDEHPALVRILTAQAAETAGDLTAAKAAYGAMVAFPEMRLAGLKGLMQTALAEGDRAAALRHAETAYGLARTARWAWRAVLEARLEAGDWAGALELVKSALDRKIVSPIVADRTRAALLTALAASLEAGPRTGDDKARRQALDHAVQSARLAPSFAPGAVMAARLAGDARRAAGYIEAAWKLEPHPALWLAYRDLNTAETPRERARRLAALAALKPDHRESRILMVEQALIAGEIGAARAAAAELSEEPLTARLAGLFARAANAAGALDEARAWIARGAAAPQEADWSDLDPEGQAFNYQPGDWARLVATYGETGELIHPRLERRERAMSDLPELPVSYVESTPFVAAAETGAVALAIDDPGIDGLYEPEPEEPPPEATAPKGRRRRLATAPRPAK
ncbi:MAG TPA: heme biosynthesis HemY N-terminal domain-containing protein [Caulobacter sp.]|nr:heme biosynthesis HemY N-terminal domain-containing protein [Caulobacter sp.]